ncbi:MAG TPA: PSD1 and planctomycete cytochrome C domain-containing protein [Lacunisphaera sp.]|nr:PSD1 and planctomycete cytochrome C domain-containing protein [Lacunisphaera sp.]
MSALLLSCSLAYSAEPALAKADIDFFEARVRPVLSDKCYKCHSHTADKIKGGLLLDSRDALLSGGSSGAAIVPGKPDDSLLIQAIRYTDADLKMPPEDHGGQLSAQQIADLTEWVRRGAPDPRVTMALAGGKSYGGVGKNHWAFQPVQVPAVPVVKNASWTQSPVDNFVLARLEAGGLSPGAHADKRTLIRRATFDLIGLPPTEAEIQRFLADDSPQAFAKVVDRLLESPHYGERWARHWMDVARYSDTKGDAPRRDDPRFPHAWTYRDYLIESFNADKPFNQFIVEQLAADRLVNDAVAAARTAKREPPTDQHILAALGFLTLGNQHDGRRNDIIDDRIDVTTKAFLGLTVSCARCHDHKFDPIPTKDYYSLYSVFANTVEPRSIMLAPTLQTRVPITPELNEYMAKGKELQDKAADLQKEFQEFRRSRTRDPNKRRELVRAEGQLQREIGNLEMNHPGAPARAHALTDVANPHDYPVLLRGEVGNTGEIAPRRFLEILSPDPKKRPTWTHGSGRLELAQAIADPKNPLTARVIVNRVWQQHFGAGFVLTPDNLGNMGGPPTHPELLDWLAAKFIADGWSLKQLHRTILLSSTYQQSSDANPAGLAADPGNKLLWHYGIRRFDFEEIYDSLLAIAGTLDRTIGGKSVTTASEGFAKRRALYFLIDRRNPPELLTQFDFPNPDTPSGQRYDTTVPQQALFLMNSPLVVETARKLTHRPEFSALARDEERVTSLYLAIFQRPPTTREVELGLHYVRSNPSGTSLEPPPEPPAMKTARERQREQRQAQRAALAGRQGVDQRPVGSTIEHGGPVDAWTKLAHALFQTNEAMYIN